MMNYEIFKEVVKEKFMDYMPEKFKGMELVAEPVEKVNVTLDGIILREEGRNISPTIYINDMYKKYQNCGDLEETLMAACDFMLILIKHGCCTIDTLFIGYHPHCLLRWNLGYHHLCNLLWHPISCKHFSHNVIHASYYRWEDSSCVFSSTLKELFLTHPKSFCKFICNF